MQELRNNRGCGTMLLGAAMFVIGIICSNGVVTGISVITFLLGTVLLNIPTKRNDEEKQKELAIEHARKVEIANDKYSEVCATLNKPCNTETLMLKLIGTKLKAKYGQRAVQLDLWFRDNELMLMITQKCATDAILLAAQRTSASELDVDALKELIYTEKIPVKNIRFYQKNGDIQREVKITGGGGGGSSIEGAIVGGLIAGGAGAVVGSRKKIDPIKSETLVHDEREVVLYYYENDNDTMLQKITFFDDAYQIFLSWMPEKEYQAVNALVKPELTKQVSVEPIKKAETSTNTLSTELLELVKLKESGVLTEEEFALAKKNVLKNS